LVSQGDVTLEHDLSFFALAPDRRTLFVAYDNGVSAYDYDAALQEFTHLGSAETHGGGTHVAVTENGKRILVAHYAANLLSLVTFDPKAGLSTIQELTPGENAHQVTISQDGQFVYVPCLGSDHIAQYLLGERTELVQQARPSVSATGGPRHMAFHPNAPLAYVLTERSSQLHIFDVDTQTGSLAVRPTASVFTAADGLEHWSSDLQLTPDGNQLYAVNRDPSEIVHFQVLADHALERRASYPLSAPVRAFAMDPRGGYLLVGGNDGRLVRLEIHADTGQLSERSSLDDLGNIRQTVISYR
jgi:6-phosphogluconolactonase